MKNNKKDIDALSEVIECMKDMSADACSEIWQDEEGKTLLAAFASFQRLAMVYLPSRKLLYVTFFLRICYFSLVMCNSTILDTRTILLRISNRVFSTFTMAFVLVFFMLLLHLI
jgi:hypothetical protein